MILKLTHDLTKIMVIKEFNSEVFVHLTVLYVAVRSRGRGGHKKSSDIFHGIRFSKVILFRAQIHQIIFFGTFHGLHNSTDYSKFFIPRLIYIFTNHSNF